MYIHKVDAKSKLPVPGAELRVEVNDILDDSMSATSTLMVFMTPRGGAAVRIGIGARMTTALRGTDDNDAFDIKGVDAFGFIGMSF